LIDLLNFTELLYRSLIISRKLVSSYKLYVKKRNRWQVAYCRPIRWTS